MLHQYAALTSRLPRTRVWTNGSHWRAFAAASTAASTSRVLFFGTDDVSVATLKKLYTNRFDTAFHEHATILGWLIGWSVCVFLHEVSKAMVASSTRSM